MRVAVVGGRDFTDYGLMKATLAPLKISHIVSGGAKGADTLAIQYAKENAIPYTEFIPDWYINGVFDKTAGFTRNKKIVRASEVVYAFWNGKSKGTKSTIDFANKIGVKCFVVTYETFYEIEDEIDLWKIT
jgi:hypothetical protein